MRLPVYLFLFRIGIYQQISLWECLLLIGWFHLLVLGHIAFDVHVTLPAIFGWLIGWYQLLNLGYIALWCSVTLPACFWWLIGWYQLLTWATMPLMFRWLCLPVFGWLMGDIIAQLGATLPLMFGDFACPFLGWTCIQPLGEQVCNPLWVNDRVILLLKYGIYCPLMFRWFYLLFSGEPVYCSLVNKFATPLWVNDRVVSPVQVQAMLPAHFVVNLHTTFNGWMIRAISTMFSWMIMQSEICSYQPAIMHSMDDYSLLPKKYYVSVWRIQQNSMMLQIIHILFSVKSIWILKFQWNFQGYAYHLLQYHLIRIIELYIMLVWSHVSFHVTKCNNVSQFWLTPKQYCQRLRFTLCQSQFYKHDFAVIFLVLVFSQLSCSKLCKYLESIICQIIQHKYICKCLSVWCKRRL